MAKPGRRLGAGACLIFLFLLGFVIFIVTKISDSPTVSSKGPKRLSSQRIHIPEIKSRLAHTLIRYRLNPDRNSEVTQIIELLNQATGAAWNAYSTLATENIMTSIRILANEDPDDLNTRRTLKKLSNISRGKDVILRFLKQKGRGLLWEFGTLALLSPTDARMIVNILQSRQGWGDQYLGQAAVHVVFEEGEWRIADIEGVKVTSPRFILFYAYDFTTDRHFTSARALNLQPGQKTLLGDNFEPGLTIGSHGLVSDTLHWAGSYSMSTNKICFSVENLQLKMQSGIAEGHTIGIGYVVKFLNSSLVSPRERPMLDLWKIGKIEVDTVLLSKLKIGLDECTVIEQFPACHDIKSDEH